MVLNNEQNENEKLNDAKIKLIIHETDLWTKLFIKGQITKQDETNILKST